MLLPGSEEYHLLYTDEFGDDVGLDEVQLLDPPLEERVPKLCEMLNSSNAYLSYQSALVLTAWGKDIGLNKVTQFIDTEIVSTFEFSPHRITDEDNVYDDLSYAIYLYGLSGGDRDKMLDVFKKILAIYPKYFFESKLKHGLIKTEFVELTFPIEKAIKETLSKGRVYQASQLLPVLAKLNPKKGWEMIPSFTSFSRVEPDPIINVTEALKYCSSKESINLLKQYSSSDSSIIADEAKKSLSYLLMN